MIVSAVSLELTQCCGTLTFVAVSEPNVPTNLQAAVNVDSLTVTWDAPTSGEVGKYTVEVTEVSGSKKNIPNINSRTAEFTGLIAGKQYTVVVAAVSGVPSSGGQKSDNTVGHFYTSKSHEQLHQKQNNTPFHQNMVMSF